MKVLALRPEGMQEYRVCHRQSPGEDYVLEVQSAVLNATIRSGRGKHAHLPCASHHASQEADICGYREWRLERPVVVAGGVQRSPDRLRVHEGVEEPTSSDKRDGWLRMRR